MKIAISGTHGVGKSTLIDAFLSSHSNFTHEPEPYEVLQEQFGESFAADPSAEDFHRQLEYNLERIRSYQSDDLVIFERCPVDYLAYLFALADLRRDHEAATVLERALSGAREAVRELDIIIFLPATEMIVDLPEEEDLELRSAVDARLESILLADDLGLFTSGRPAVIEAVGPTSQRLKIVERALTQIREKGRS